MSSPIIPSDFNKFSGFCGDSIRKSHVIHFNMILMFNIIAEKFLMGWATDEKSARFVCGIQHKSMKRKR